MRKPSRSSKAEKRRIEEQDRASLDKAARASRDPPAPKRKHDNEDLEEDGTFGRFERSRTFTLDSDADRDAMATSDYNDFEDQMQDRDRMELVDRK